MEINILKRRDRVGRVGRFLGRVWQSIDNKQDGCFKMANSESGAAKAHTPAHVNPAGSIEVFGASRHWRRCRHSSVRWAVQCIRGRHPSEGPASEKLNRKPLLASDSVHAKLIAAAENALR